MVAVPGATRAPIDPAIPHLEYALEPGCVEPLLREPLRSLLGERGSFEVYSARLVRHKPGRRCMIEYVLRVPPCAGDPEEIRLLGKIRASGVDASSYQVQRALWRNGLGDRSVDGISVAEPIGIIRELGMWLQRSVPGAAPVDLFSHPEGEGCARRIADAAHRLHNAGIQPRRSPHTIVDELGILHKRLPQVARQRPHLAERIDRVLRACNRLAATVRTAVPRGIHRDFYPDQVLLAGDRLYIIDLDLYCEGDPALDIGNFIGHLMEESLRRTGDPNALAPQQDALADQFALASGSDSVAAVDVYTTLTLARHISISTQFPARQAFTEEILALVERRLDRRPEYANRRFPCTAP